MEGWGKIPSAALYAGVSPRTLRKWLKKGLRHSKPMGAILIKFSDIDKFLGNHVVCVNEVDSIVDGVMAELTVK